MNTLSRLFLALLIPASLWAQTAEDVVARLIEQAWAPKTVRVEWTFSGKAPAALEQNSDWQLAAPVPAHLAGSIILAFQRKEQATTRKVVVTGTAHIFGPCLMVKEPVASGKPVDVSNLDSLEGEWTYLNGDAAQFSDFSTAKVATRALTPGRAITRRDIKGANLILRGQNVDVKYVDGAVRIRFIARALKDGSVGETIPLASDLVTSKHLNGTVAQDGTVEFVR